MLAIVLLGCMHSAFLFDNETYENAEMQIKAILDQKVTSRGTNTSGGMIALPTHAPTSTR
jgi:hypothetical protein